MTNKLLFLIFSMSLTINACMVDVTPLSDQFFLRFEGADLFVKVDGNRSSNVFILLLHGGPGGDGHDYNNGPAADMLEDRYAVAYLDQRGQGVSQGKYGEERITLMQYARDAEAVAKAIKARYGSEVHVFLSGHSWGGLVGTAALVDTEIESLISGWIEVSGAHDIPKLNREIIKLYQERAPGYIAAGQNVEHWTEVLDYVNSLDTNSIGDELSSELNAFGFKTEQLINEVNAIDPEAFELSKLLNSPLGLTAYISTILTGNLALEATESIGLTNRLHEITTPTLLLWGEHDYVVPFTLGISAFNRISSEDKSLIIFNHSGHSPMDNEPEAYVEAIVSFVERNTTE